MFEFGDTDDIVHWNVDVLWSVDGHIKYIKFDYLLDEYFIDFSFFSAAFRYIPYVAM